MPRHFDANAALVNMPGYTAHGHSGMTNWEGCKRYQVKAACLATLRDLGITLGSGWDLDSKLWELIAVLDGLHRLLAVAGWSYADFKWAMGINYGAQLIFDRKDKHANGYFANATAEHDIWQNKVVKNTIIFYDIAFQDSPGDYGDAWTTAGANAVHELAHVWDYVRGERGRLMHEVGAIYELCCPLGHYNPGGTTTSRRGALSSYEDWAESVTAAVYPMAPRYFQDPTIDPSSKGYTGRIAHVHNRFAQIPKLRRLFPNR